MKIEEYNAVISEITQAIADPTKVDIPKITAGLAKINDGFSENVSALDTATKEAKANKEAYEGAVKYNMQLFQEKAVKPATTTTVTPPEDKKQSISGLDLSDF